jgi:hypothetical protein
MIGVNMHNILEDLLKKRKIMKGILFGLAAVSVVLVCMLSVYYVTFIAY